jgi:hypothetical protein
MISAKAGLVNYVDGQSNVRVHQQVMAGESVETGPQSHAELLLNPGSFLRVDERSKVILDSVELARIGVHVVEGAALIEVADIGKETPIRVTTGNLRALIIAPGVYRLSDNTAAVLDGRLRLVDKSKTVKKGHQVTLLAGNYVVNSIDGIPNDGLDRWSRERSGDLARANAAAYHDQSAGNGYSFSGYGLGASGYGGSYGYVPDLGMSYPYSEIYGIHPSWLYSPLLGGFTFIPVGGYRSYWGYSFMPAWAFAGRAPSAFGFRPGYPGGSLSGRPGGGPGRGPATGGRPGGGFHGGGHAGGHGGGGHR